MINYITGDVTKPIGDGHKYIVHICNDIGAWGAGVSGAIGRKWPAAEKSYRQWKNLQLGTIQIVPIKYQPISVVNLVGQKNLRSKANPSPVRYDAIEKGLKRLHGVLIEDISSTSIHMPRIGCGLAGGKWDIIRCIIVENIKDFDVFVYDLG